MSKGLLDNGVESMGAVHKAYDKYGKRMYTATPKRDGSTQHRSMSVGRKAGNSSAVSGDQTRVDNGTK